MTRFLTSTALALSFLVVAASPAFAQSKAELAAQNEMLRQRVDRLEARMLTGDPAAERLMARVDTLETTIRTLRGEVERMTYERDQKDAQIDALESDILELQALATRMKIHLDAVELVAAEQRTPTPPRVDPSYQGGPTQLSPLAGPPSTTERQFELSAPTANPANDVTQLGEIGKRKLAEGDYIGAQTALSQYVQFNPDAPDLGEANYWLGESFYVRGAFADAADSYIAAMKIAPKGPKAPDALVKLAASMRELGQTAEACGALASFLGQFPNASVDAREKANREAARTGC